MNNSSCLCSISVQVGEVIPPDKRATEVSLSEEKQSVWHMPEYVILTGKPKEDSLDENACHWAKID